MLAICCIYWHLRIISCHFECCMIFDVARSTIQGNAKASVRGTSDEEIPRFPFILIANLGMKGWLGKEFLWIIEKQKNCVKSGVISLVLIQILRWKLIWIQAMLQ